MRRLHRLQEGKREVQVYDYADLDVSMLARMFERRCAGYEALGFIHSFFRERCSRWPAEVPLPMIHSGNAIMRQVFVALFVTDGCTAGKLVCACHSSIPSV